MRLRKTCSWKGCDSWATEKLTLKTKAGTSIKHYCDNHGKQAEFAIWQASVLAGTSLTVSTTLEALPEVE